MFKKRDANKRTRKLTVKRETLHKLQELSPDDLDQVAGGRGQGPFVPGGGGWGKPTNCCR